MNLELNNNEFTAKGDGKISPFFFNGNYYAGNSAMAIKYETEYGNSDEESLVLIDLFRKELEHSFVLKSKDDFNELFTNVRNDFKPFQTGYFWDVMKQKMNIYIRDYNTLETSDPDSFETFLSEIVESSRSIYSPAMDAAAKRYAPKVSVCIDDEGFGTISGMRASKQMETVSSAEFRIPFCSKSFKAFFDLDKLSACLKYHKDGLLVVKFNEEVNTFLFSSMGVTTILKTVEIKQK